MTFRHPLRRHISDEQLARFADGAASAAEHRRVASHTATCSWCLERVVSRMGRTAFHGANTTVRVRDDALSIILDRRSRGERILLPTGDAGGDRTAVRRLPVYAAAAATLLIGLTTFFVASENVSASDISGELRLTPELPLPGDSIHAEYRGTRFAGGDRVRLRATFMAAGDDEPEWAARYGTVDMLVRGRDGVYRGSFVLPQSIVYGAFVVEDTTGHVVDANGGKLWEVLVRDSAGRPAFAAMRQRMRFISERDQQASFETAREMPSIHPNEVEGWQIRLWYELELGGSTAADSITSQYAEHFAGAHARLSATAVVSPQAMESMLLYASQMGADSVTTYWSRRLATEYPKSPQGVQQRLWATQDTAPDSRAYHAAIEQIWEDASPDARKAIAMSGFMSARQSGNPVALLKWGERLERFGSPWYYGSAVGYTFAEVFGLERQGQRRLREHLREFADTNDLHRIIGRSVPQYATEMAKLRASLLLALGESLAATNDYENALDTLQLSANLAWDARTYSTIARVRLHLRDSAGAARAAAFASVQEEAPTKGAVSLRQRYAASTPDSIWSQWIAEGGATLRRQIIATSVSRPLRATVRLVNSAGEETELADVMHGAPTVVAFWSRYCIPSLEQLPEFQRAARQLEADGVRVVAITSEAPSTDLRDWMKRAGYTFDVYHDIRGEAATVLERSGTPDHVVIDAAGRIRFERLRNARELASRVAALR